MTGQTIARTFAEQLRECAVGLGLDLDPQEAELSGPPEARDAPTTPIDLTIGDDGHAGLDALLTELEAVGATLAAIARQDQAAREEARHQLERYDGLVASRAEAERVAAAATALRRRADALAARAF